MATVAPKDQKGTAFLSSFFSLARINALTTCRGFLLASSFLWNEEEEHLRCIYVTSGHE
jgi:hypothetical protein